jgi:hypothetical protein
VQTKSLAALVRNIDTMRTHRIIIATLFFAVATSTNAATVTSFTIFSADSSGARAFGQAWNTQGGDGVWATGIIHESPELLK